MTKTEIKEALEELVEAGIMRRTGRYRKGQPVYVLVPDTELTESAREILNAMAKHRPS